jgi:hypothetical protein
MSASALAYMQQQGVSADGQKAMEAQYAIWQLQGASSPRGRCSHGEVAEARWTE